MDKPKPITATIVNTLYDDALHLAEETRAQFDFASDRPAAADSNNELHIALSCEALRTTTRLMHAMAWLLNYRAFFAGEMTEFQLQRHGRLPPPQPKARPEHLAMMDPDISNLIARSVALYERIERLDHAWADEQAEQISAVNRLQQQLGKAFASD